MSTARGRTAAAAVLAGAIGARITASAPLDASSARIAADPEAAVRHAADGWSAAGSLGVASADGLRELPLAAAHWLGSEVGLSPDALSTGLRVLVLVLAVIGAVRVARAVAGEGKDSWAPWVAALLFACGPALAAATVRSPLEGLAVAAMPSALAPVLERRPGWRAAAGAAVWAGVAGVGGPLWGLATLVVIVAASTLAARRQPGRAVLVLLATLVACGWWLWALAWEVAHARDLTPASPPWAVALADALAWPGTSTPWLVLAAAAPALVVAAALLLRAPSLPALSPLLVVAAGLGVLGWSQGWTPVPVTAGPADVLPSLLAPALAWASLAGLLAWPALSRGLRARLVVRDDRRPTVRGSALALLAGVLAIATASTALAAVRERPASEPALTGTWAEVAAWSAAAPPGRVLVVPPRDERESSDATRALAGRPWVTRTPLPTSTPAATTAVDDVVARLARGIGDVGTADALRRLGVSFVLLRADRTLQEDRARPAGLVRAALQEQGATRTAVLGDAGSELVDYGVRTAEPQIEVWALAEPAEARVYDGEPLTVAGDAGAVADLANAGLSGSRALRVVDGGEDDAPAIVSDSARRREVDQRVATDPLGRDLGADEERRVVPRGAAAPSTAVRALSGARTVTASSSSADLGVVDGRAGSDAASAIDGNPYTAWLSAPGDIDGAWWEVGFDDPTDLEEAAVQLIGNRVTGFPVTDIRVETDRETVRLSVPQGGLVTLGLAQPATRLRITVTGVTAVVGDLGTVGISEVTVPDVEVLSQHVVADRPTDAWVLATRPTGQDGCVPGVGTETAPAEELSTVCASGLAVEGPDTTAPLRRTITSDDDRVVDGVVWTHAVDTEQAGAVADQLAAPTIRVTATSSVAPDLDVRPQTVADDDPATAWSPAVSDREPTLTLTWEQTRTIRELRLETPTGGSWSTPTQVRIGAITAAGAFYSREAPVRPDGSVSFPRFEARSMTVTVLADTDVKSDDSYLGGVREVPVAIAEIELVGGPDVTYDADRVEALACGSGPPVTVAGQDVETRLTVSAAEVVSGATVRARFCTRPELPRGDSTVTAVGTFTWAALGVLLRRSTAGTADMGPTAPSAYDAPPADLRVGALVDPRTERAVTVTTAGPHVLTLAVPADDGWTARGAGDALESVTVDGWAQGWVVPDGVGEVTFRYSSADDLGLGVVVGAVTWVLVLLVLLVAVVGGLLGGLARRRGRPEPRR